MFLLSFIIFSMGLHFTQLLCGVIMTFHVSFPSYIFSIANGLTSNSGGIISLKKYFSSRKVYLTKHSTVFSRILFYAGHVIYELIDSFYRAGVQAIKHKNSLVSNVISKKKLPFFLSDTPFLEVKNSIVSGGCIITCFIYHKNDC